MPRRPRLAALNGEQTAAAAASQRQQADAMQQAVARFRLQPAAGAG